MSRFHVEGSTLYYGDTTLGPSHLPVVDGRESGVRRYILPSHATITNLPVGDVVFWNGDWVVGVELKWAKDLVTSWRNRRLASEMRRLIEAVDVPCLATNFYGVEQEALASHGMTLQGLDKLRLDVVKLECLGVVLLERPRDAELMVYLERVATALRPKPSLLAAIAGNPKERKVLPRERVLMGVSGVGLGTAKKLLEKWGSAAEAISHWREWDVSKRVKAKEALDG